MVTVAATVAPHREAPSRPGAHDGDRRQRVQLVTVVVPPHHLEAVKDAAVTAGATGVTVSDAGGEGHEPDQVEAWMGNTRQVSRPRVRVEVLVTEADSHRIVEAILAHGHTGRIGDGKVWVTAVEQLVRIRTGERGPDAL